MPTQDFATSWRHLVLDAVFPPRCAGQQERCEGWSREIFCASCVQTLHRIPTPFCAVCGTPFRVSKKDAASAIAASAISTQNNSLENAATNFAEVCADCRANRYHAAPPFDGLRSLYVFEGAIRRAVHRLKYDNKTALAKPLAVLMRDFLPLSSTRFVGTDALTQIVAVPLHARRQRRRGFNQSELLARELSHLANVPLQQNLMRTRDTTPQVELSVRERATNVQGAFALNPNANVKGAAILLIDDVHTTGATLRECAQVLKNGGAQKVYGLTLARAL